MAALRCASARREMEALADGRMAPRRAAALRAHVDGCAACGGAYAAFSELREALRALPPEALPAGFGARLHRRLAAAVPERPRARWWVGALPAATAVAGFLAAAAIAQPLLAPRGAQGAAASQQAAVTSGALQQAQTPAPIGGVQPALFPYAAAAQGGPAGGAASSTASGSAAAPVSATGPGFSAAMLPSGGASTSAAGAASGTAAAPPAVSLTLLASAPAQAVQTLGDFAVAGGGRVITTFLGPSSAAGEAPGAPQPVATLDAVIPGVSVASYAARARTLGTILAQVADAPAGETQPVRLIVTVLAAPPAAPAATVQAGSTPAAAAGSQRSPEGWEARTLIWAARAAPWAAAGCAAVLLGAAGLRLWGRRRQ